MKHSRSSLVVLVLLVLGASAASQWWAGRSDASVGQQLAGRAQPGDIRMLSSTTCAYCGAARAWMRQHQVSFGECFIETDKDCAALYESLGTPGTPVLVVRGKAQLGFDAQRVLGALAVPAS